MSDEKSLLHPDPSLTAEEATRQWWLAHYDTPMPEEIKLWLKAMSNREVQRARIAEHLLDDATLLKVRESRRLCQTKLDNVESSLQRVHQQQEWLRRFVRFSTELRQQQQHLYEINKHQASILTQQKELERFETFEAINSRFQRIHNLGMLVADARQRQGRVAVEIDLAQRGIDEAEKRVVIEQGKASEYFKLLIQSAQTMADTERLMADSEAFRQSYADCMRRLNVLTDRLNVLQKQERELLQMSQQLKTKTADLKLQYQALESHHHLITHGEAAQILLEEFQRTKDLRDELKVKVDQATKRHNERNEQLSRLFMQNQDIDDDIKAKKEEVQGHRRSIAGQNSHSLQQRAMELRGRRLMLVTALSLWRSIAAGYDQLEHKSQVIAQLRLEADHLNRNIDALDKEVRQLGRHLEQKTYHWTLSKSQNVIELRGDLEEGVPCTVCGATHHPWHSESVVEQNALIATMKAECENLDREYRIKSQQLQDLQLKLTATQGKLEVETANIALLKDRQQKDTDEWKTFSQLDRSLAECSPSTNREARTAMMSQLIEKTTVDAEEAEKELTAFNYHMNAINTLGGLIQQRQQDSADLAVRLNEVNTACQVMAGQVERLKQRLGTTHQEYSRRYERLDKLITMPDWFHEWTRSPEGVRLRIQDMMERWQQLSEAIAGNEREMIVMEAQMDLLQHDIRQTQSDINATDIVADKLMEHVSSNDNEINKLQGETTSRLRFNQQCEKQTAQEGLCNRQRQEYVEQLRYYLGLTARHGNLEESIHVIEEQMAKERQQLDIWMRQYNANNPPVQYAELERVLADGKSWGDVRTEIRQVRLEQAVTQARVDNLRAEIIALQAEGMHPVADNGENEQNMLREQCEELEQQRRQILQQMAHLDEQLRMHECATKATLG